MPLGDLRALPAESPLWGDNPEGVTDPRQGMKREARNPCSHGVKRENPEGVTDHRQVYNPCVIDSGICRTFGQGLYPCLGSVVPSALRGLVARKAGVTRYALHHLPGVFRPFGATVPLRKSPNSLLLASLLLRRVGEDLGSGRILGDLEDPVQW